MVTKKEQLFEQYLELTRQALDSRDPDRMECLIEERDQLISQINTIDSQYGAILMSENIKKIIQAIQPLDQQLLEKMKSYKDEAQCQLQQVKQAKLARRKYEMTPIQTEGFFCDKRR